jgi:outer membrane protease
MSRCTILMLALLFVLAPGVKLYAEYLFLKDGSIVECKILDETSKAVTVRMKDGKTFAYERSNVMRVVYTKLYMGKVFIHMTDGRGIEAYIVDEDQDKYTVRMDISKLDEFTIKRTDVLFMVRKNPTGLQGKISKKKVELAWSPPYNPVKYYKIYVKTKGGEYRAVGESESTRFTIMGLDCNMEYFAIVTAIDKDNYESLPSNELTIVTLEVGPACGENISTNADKPGKIRGKIVQIDLENGFDRYFYYTRYRIGGIIISRDGLFPGFFPISELIFPIDVFTIYADLNLTFMDRLTVHYNVKKNIQIHAGKMKDSDWVLPTIKAVYSESDARLNAVFTDADLIVRLFTRAFFSLKLGVGFMHEYMYYTCSNVKQTNYLYGDSPYLKILGKGLTYEVQYYMPTVQIIPVFTIMGRFDIMLVLRAAPYIKAKDKDDHLLRAKKSTSTTTGSAWLPGIKMRYLFSNSIFITANLDYLYLNTKGKQTQSYYLPTLEAGKIPGWSARLDTELQSQQFSVSLGAGYSFEF